MMLICYRLKQNKMKLMELINIKHGWELDKTVILIELECYQLMFVKRITIILIMWKMQEYY